MLVSGADRTLHAEVAAGDLDEVKHALENGADVNLAMPSDYAPQLIHTAIKFKRDKILKLLLEKGANADAKIGDDSALHQAVEQRSVVLTKLLLDHGANPNVAYSSSRYVMKRAAPLHILARGELSGQTQAGAAKTNPKTQQTEIEIAKLLLKSGANPSLVAEMNRTALQLAEIYKPHLVALLQEKPAEDADK